MENQKSAIGLDANLAAALGYPIGIIALISIFIEKENKLVRFHAIQSLLWGLVSGLLFAVMFIGSFFLWFGGAIFGAATNAATGSSAGGILGGILGIVGLLLLLLSIVVALGGFGAMVFAAIKSYGGAKVKLPLVGKFAEKWSS